MSSQKYRIKLTNDAAGWAEVLEQPSFQNIVDRLATRRPWEIEDTVEADEAGWVAYARENGTIFTISLMMPVGLSEAPPARIIEWTLEADAEREEPRRLNLPLAATMLGTGGLSAALGIHWGAPLLSIPFLAMLGIFPVGLLLGIFGLPLVIRRPRRQPPVAGRAEFLKEVAAVVAQLPAQP